MRPNTRVATGPPKPPREVAVSDSDPAGVPVPPAWVPSGGSASDVGTDSGSESDSSPTQMQAQGELAAGACPDVSGGQADAMDGITVGEAEELVDVDVPPALPPLTMTAIDQPSGIGL